MQGYQQIQPGHEGECNWPHGCHTAAATSLEKGQPAEDRQYLVYYWLSCSPRTFDVR